ncbi:cytochrome b-561 domain containing 1 [Nannochloropsis oceanica]
MLDAATDRRRLLLARIKFLDPLVAPNLLIHILALSLLLWIWGISLARAHTFTLFSFHPVFMSLGCVLFMTEGILAYRNHACFSFLAPIMRNSARVKLQNIHRGFQILAASCIALGIAFIFGNKVRKHRTIFPTSIHAALGFLVCALLVLQVLAGLEKLDAQRSGVMVSKPFRPTGEGGLTERELVELRRDGGGEGGGEGGGRGPRGSMGGRKDSNGGEIGESL